MISAGEFAGSSNPVVTSDNYSNTFVPSNGYSSGPPSMEMVCVKEEEEEDDDSTEDSQTDSIVLDVESPAQQPQQRQQHTKIEIIDRIKDDPLRTTTTTTTGGPHPSNNELREWLKCFRDKILKPILKLPKSLPFRRPVDPIALGIYPAYNNAIKHPMDLGTIRKRIDANKYTSKEQCINDLMLVWMNALTFNPPMHYVYNAALEFKKITTARLERLEREGVAAFSLSTRKSGKKSSGGSRQSSGPRKESTSRKTFKSERTPSTNRQPQRYSSAPPSSSGGGGNGGGNVGNGLQACDTLMRSLLGLRHHCDFVEPFIGSNQVQSSGQMSSPLSLTRIERKLHNQQYNDYTEFASDMRQMFTETYKYNSPDSEIVTAAGKLQKEFEVRFAKMNFQDRKPVRPALLPQSLSDEDQFAVKLRSAQNFMRKIEAELKELIRDYHRMKNRRKRKLIQQHRNGVAETGAQINAACIAVVDAFSSSSPVNDDPLNHHHHHSSSYNVDPAASSQHLHHQQQQQLQYNNPLPKKPRYDPPPVLTLQEANELKEQISQLHPDQQLQILEILQNNGEQLFPDEHGEVEIEIAKCCLGSVKQVRAYLQNLKAQIKLNDESTVTSSVDPIGINPSSGEVAVKREERAAKRSSSDSSSSDSSDSSDSSSESD